jgi:hypothetical protein
MYHVRPKPLRKWATRHRDGLRIRPAGREGLFGEPLCHDAGRTVCSRTSPPTRPNTHDSNRASCSEVLRFHLMNQPVPYGSAALRHLVTEVPPPLVAELLGYSYQVT